MKSNVRALLILIAMAALAVASASCQKKAKMKAETIEEIQKREGIPVTTLNVQRGTLRDIELVGGTLEGERQTTLVCNVPGQVQEIYARVGEGVAKGGRLLRMDPDMPSPLEMSEAQYKNAEKSKERLDALAQEGGVSQEIVDQVESGLVAARASYKYAAKTEILTAPYSGTVTQIYQSLGSTVDRGRPLVDLATLDRVRLKAQVSEAVIHRFAVGQPARIALGSDTIEGRVTLVSLSGGAASHSFSIEALFANPGRRLRPGMFVTASIVVEERKNAITVPMESLVQEGDRNFLFLVENDQARKIAVQTGIRGGSMYEILQGIDEGQLFVKAGMGNLVDGVKVKLVTETVTAQ